ncbi:GGDEF domain-containing protein, partial [Methylobacterium platani]
RLEAELRRLADTDPLPGALPRRRFLEVCARDWPRRPGHAACLLMLDLDHFKAINDRHGHAAGDAVLRLFAETARRIAGPDALVARLGGEEFAALLPGRDVAAARRTGEEIARRFAGAGRQGEGPGIPATVSVGLAAARPGLDDLSSLLSAADRALYRAKAGGRNRLEVAAAA